MILYAVIAGFLAFIGALGAAVVLGRRTGAADTLEADARAGERIAQVDAQAPRTREELANAIRDKGLL